MFALAGDVADNLGASEFPGKAVAEVVYDVAREILSRSSTRYIKIFVDSTGGAGDLVKASFLQLSPL